LRIILFTSKSIGRAALAGYLGTLAMGAVALAAEHSGEVPAGLTRMGDGLLFPAHALVVDKSKKKIHVLDNSSGTPVLVETFDADLGKKPGPKHSTGDHRTPEGIYFFNKQLEGTTLDPVKYGVRAFVTDYPNFFDLRDGKSGYGIWLHAIDDKETLERGSRGCVVVRNDTIKLLSKYITLFETPILIFDKVQWIPVANLKKEGEDILQMITRWRKAWESKELDGYMSFYDQDFRFGKMNREKFREYKAELAKKYTDIKVSLSMPVIYEHKSDLVVKFFQTYSSPDHSDFGQKTLLLKRRGDGFTILNEEWREATDPKLQAQAGTTPCCQN
jgi:murein L,D-transpeptidase YafK